VLLANAGYAIWQLLRAPSLGTAFAALVAAAILALGVVARNMVLTVQDRVIRLEMRLRLSQVLPPDLRGRISELSPKQLIELRFASDAELPELTRHVLASNLTKRNAIKQLVKNWEADYLRA